MAETKLQKGFVISLPKIIVEKAHLKEGEKLIVQSPDSGIIVLEKPNLPNAVEASRGLWSNRKEIGKSARYVKKIRNEWDKRLRRMSSGK